METLAALFTPQLVEATVRLAAPVILAAMAAVVCERSGVTNIAMEGIMLVGAFFAALVAWYTGSPWLGLVGGAAAGALYSLFFAWAAISLHFNHVVAGAIMNILAFGLTRYLMMVAYGRQGTSNAVARTLHDYKTAIPVLSDIPFIGKAFFDQTPIVYLALLSVVAWAWIFKRTRLGLSIEASGEYPMALETMGRSVVKTRYTAVVLGGVMCGLAGAFLSIENSNSFTEGMTDGRGFIALAANIAGGWRPVGVFLASLFFGFVDALQLRAQGLGVIDLPSELFLVFPYVATIAAVAGLVKRSRPPAAVGKDFSVEGGGD
ncbi:MAG: ABC transporter permease [Spirochaetes bacterium]|nr:ABC transporter permease [Spirochaetota bacterium]MBU1080286.1 ABC transporter permease [Spirochaetota bacterium]